MRIKVPVNFIDGTAFSKAMHTAIMPLVAVLPLAEREAAYDDLYEKMEALHHLLRERTYMEVDLNFDTKKARIVSAVCT